MEVHVFPWVLAMWEFHRGHPVRERSGVYLKENQMEGEGKRAGYEVLFGFVEEFVGFVKENVPYHPQQKYKIRTRLIQYAEDITPPKHPKHFKPEDAHRLTRNLTLNHPNFKR